LDSRFVQIVGHPDVGEDYELTAAILENKFDLIFFTGSSNGGKYVMSQAAKQLTPVVLEMGGKNPVIVDSSADIDVACKQILFSRVINCGQQCISPDYVLCEQEVVDQFIERCQHWSKQFFR